MEDIVINFHNGTAASVSGKTINNYSSGLTSGTLDSDLSGYDTGASTGVSLALSASMTTDSNGRLQPDPPGAGSLTPEINRQGAYSDKNAQAANDFDFTLTFPSNVESVQVELFCCTTYSGQTTIDFDVNGATNTGFDATNNTSGNTVSFVSPVIAPDGSNQVIINTFNTSGNRFVFHNGIRIFNIVESGTTIDGATESLSLTAHSASVSLDAQIAALNEALVLVSYAASLAAQTNISANLESLSLTSYLASVVADTNVSASAESLALTANSSAVTVSDGWTDDTFDGTGVLGDHWLTYQSSVQTVDRQSGYIEALVDDNTSDVTLWFQNDQGRADYQIVQFPTGATPNQYIAYDIGIGPTSNPRNDHTYVSNAFNFCGLMVHDTNFANIDYMFAVMGHRGTIDQSTIEIKSTVSGSSSVTDEGSNVIGTGVTHCDLAVELHRDGSVLFKYREVGGTEWTYVNSGTGLTPTPRPNLGSAGDSVALCFIAYASGTTGLPFIGSANAILAFEQVYDTEAYQITSYPASIEQDSQVAADIESLTLQAYAAALNRSLEAGFSALSLSAYAADVSLGLNVSTQALTLSQFVAAVSINTDIPADVESLVLSGNQADVRLGTILEGSSVSLQLVSNQAGITFDAMIDALTESLQLSGLPSDVSLTQLLSADLESLTLTPQGATITIASGISANLESLNLTAFNPVLTLPTSAIESAGLEYTLNLNKIHFTFKRW